MKKHYEKMSMTPLGMEFEANLMAGVLQGSIVDNVATVEAMPQEVENYDFTDASSPFDVDWD